MDDKQARILVLKEQIRNIHQTVYAESYDEAKMVMLNALRDRIDWLNKNDKDAISSPVV